jgi:hypothetical protein
MRDSQTDRETDRQRLVVVGDIQRERERDRQRDRQWLSKAGRHLRFPGNGVHSLQKLKLFFQRKNPSQGGHHFGDEPVFSDRCNDDRSQFRIPDDRIREDRTDRPFRFHSLRHLRQRLSKNSAVSQNTDPRQPKVILKTFLRTKKKQRSCFS